MAFQDCPQCINPGPNVCFQQMRKGVHFADPSIAGNVLFLSDDWRFHARRAGTVKAGRSKGMRCPLCLNDIKSGRKDWLLRPLQCSRNHLSSTSLQMKFPKVSDIEQAKAKTYGHIEDHISP